MTDAYCPRCDTRVPVKQIPIDHEPHLIDVCGRCENTMIHDSKEEWEEYERERIESYIECGESYKAHSDTEGHQFRGTEALQCAYCGLPRQNADDPTTLLPDGVTMEAKS